MIRSGLLNMLSLLIAASLIPGCMREKHSLVWDFRQDHRLNQIDWPDSVVESDAMVAMKLDGRLQIKLPESRVFEERVEAVEAVRDGDTAYIYYVRVRCIPESFDEAAGRVRELCREFGISTERLNSWQSNPKTMRKFEDGNNESAPTYWIEIQRIGDARQVVFQVAWERQEYLDQD